MHVPHGRGSTFFRVGSPKLRIYRVAQHGHSLSSTTSRIKRDTDYRVANVAVVEQVPVPSNHSEEPACGPQDQKWPEMAKRVERPHPPVVKTLPERNPGPDDCARNGFCRVHLISRHVR